MTTLLAHFLLTEPEVSKIFSQVINLWMYKGTFGIRKYDSTDKGICRFRRCAIIASEISDMPLHRLQ